MYYIHINWTGTFIKELVVISGRDGTGKKTIATNLTWKLTQTGKQVQYLDCDDDCLIRYCQKQDVEVLLEIPDDRRIAEAYSRGLMIVDALPKYKDKFTLLYEK